MGGAPLIIALGGLLLPIALLLTALLVDAVIVAWSVYQWWQQTMRPRFATAVASTLRRSAVRPVVRPAHR